VLPVDWEVEVLEVCVDGGAVVVVDPLLQAASRSAPTTRRLTSRMTESLIKRDSIVVPSP
jgi:hydroxymethylpyrimidine/phosphomethylpyrimidine kinase